jgi:hypothetical protein
MIKLTLSSSGLGPYYWPTSLQGPSCRNQQHHPTCKICVEQGALHDGKAHSTPQSASLLIGDGDRRRLLPAATAQTPPPTSSCILQATPALHNLPDCRTSAHTCPQPEAPTAQHQQPVLGTQDNTISLTPDCTPAANCWQHPQHKHQLLQHPLQHPTSTSLPQPLALLPLLLPPCHTLVLWQASRPTPQPGCKYTSKEHTGRSQGTWQSFALPGRASGKRRSHMGDGNLGVPNAPITYHTPRCQRR